MTLQKFVVCLSVYDFILIATILSVSIINFDTLFLRATIPHVMGWLVLRGFITFNIRVMSWWTNVKIAFHINPEWWCRKRYHITALHLSALWPWMNPGKTEWWKLGKWQVIMLWQARIGSHRSFILFRKSIVKDDSSQHNLGYWDEYKVNSVQTWDGDFSFEKTGQPSPCDRRLGMIPKQMVKQDQNVKSTQFFNHIPMNIYI